MVNCKYCGENTSNKNAICNTCKNKLNAKKYLKEVLVTFKPEEIFSKRSLGLYLDRSLNLDIVLLTLNDYGMVVRKGGNGYKLATKDEIDEFLLQEDLSLIKSKKTKKSSRKKLSKPKTSNNKKESDNEPLELKKCKVCGSDIPSNSKNDICRKCNKKIHAVNVLEEIIPITGVEITFKKEDLDNLYKNNPIKANDTIWTLQDFNLVKTIDNNTFELISEDKINQFFEKNNSSNTVSELLLQSSKNALQKTCLKCNKQLPISDFRKISENEYNDYCKICDKKIKTADYVLEIMNTVGFNEFKIDDVDISNIQGKIFNLQDNDLITFNGYFYKLADKDIIYSFINKNIDENVLFKNILDAFKENLTMIQAANKVGVSNVEVTKFYIEGKNGNPKYVQFYDEINKIKRSKIENNVCPKCKKKTTYSNAKCEKCGHINLSLLSLDKKIDFVLSHIKKNNSVKSAKELDIPYENIKKWNKLGKSGLSPYDKFYNGIITIKNESKDNALKKNKISEVESILNEYLRKIQRTELILNKNLLLLKNIDLSDETIKSEHDEAYSYINVIKNDLLFQKSEIKSIKGNLYEYSLQELNNIKSFDIKSTRPISIRVNKLLKKNDEYNANKLITVKKHIQKLEKSLLKVNENIDEVNKHILKLQSTIFVQSLKYKNNALIKELENYKFNLEENVNEIENKISQLKSDVNIQDTDMIEVNFIDYEDNVNELIYKNQNIINNQMKLILYNLDQSKTINEICSDLNISYKDFESWYELGKSNEKKYIVFYNEINKFNKIISDNLKSKSEDIESQVDSGINSEYDDIKENKHSNNILNKLRNKFSSDSSHDKPVQKSDDKKENNKSKKELLLEYYKETMDINQAAKKADIPIFLVKFWYNSGKNGDEEFIEFFNKINSIKKL